MGTSSSKNRRGNAQGNLDRASAVSRPPASDAQRDSFPNFSKGDSSSKDYDSTSGPPPAYSLSVREPILSKREAIRSEIFDPPVDAVVNESVSLPRQPSVLIGREGPRPSVDSVKSQNQGSTKVKGKQTLTVGRGGAVLKALDRASQRLSQRKNSSVKNPLEEKPASPKNDTKREKSGYPSDNSDILKPSRQAMSLKQPKRVAQSWDQLPSDVEKELETQTRDTLQSSKLRESIEGYEDRLSELPEDIKGRFAALSPQEKKKMRLSARIASVLNGFLPINQNKPQDSVSSSVLNPSDEAFKPKPKRRMSARFADRVSQIFNRGNQQSSDAVPDKASESSRVSENPRFSAPPEKSMKEEELIGPIVAEPKGSNLDRESDVLKPSPAVSAIIPKAEARIQNNEKIDSLKKEGEALLSQLKLEEKEKKKKEKAERKLSRRLQKSNSSKDVGVGLMDLEKEAKKKKRRKKSRKLKQDPVLEEPKSTLRGSFTEDLGETEDSNAWVKHRYSGVPEVTVVAPKSEMNREAASVTVKSKKKKRHKKSKPAKTDVDYSSATLSNLEARAKHKASNSKSSAGNSKLNSMETSDTRKSANSATVNTAQAGIERRGRQRGEAVPSVLMSVNVSENIKSQLKEMEVKREKSKGSKENHDSSATAGLNPYDKKKKRHRSKHTSERRQKGVSGIDRKSSRRGGEKKKGHTSMKRSQSTTKKGHTSVKKGHSSMKKGHSSMKRSQSTTKKGHSSLKKGRLSKRHNIAGSTNSIDMKKLAEMTG